MSQWDFKSMAQAMADELIQMRRVLHQWPELSRAEARTSAYIQKKLAEYGIEFQAGVAKTGVVGLIRGKAGEGRTILLRADMDALPVAELNEVAYRSQNEGVMHACGHDAHMACLLGAAKFLQDVSGELYGNVKLMFQPDEEDKGGAEPMIKEGILQAPAVDAAIALHVEPSYGCGSIAIKPGATMASPDEFDIVIKGRGGHGAYPGRAISPILVGTEVVKRIQSLPAQIESDDSVVVTVCSFQAGSFYNVIPDTATLIGTARSFSSQTRREIEKKLDALLAEVCSAMGAEYELHYRYLFPPLTNNAPMTALVEEVVDGMYGAGSVQRLSEPFMAGDDFAYVAQEVPSAYFYLGCRNEQKGIMHPWHSPQFDIDEDCLPMGAGVLAAAAARFLNDQK